MNVAIVHDWLVGMRGGERCLEVIASLFPSADIFTLFYEPAGISEQINRHRIVPSRLNSIPGVAGCYRHLLPIYDLGIRELSRKIAGDGAPATNGTFAKYDLVISVSHCVAKNIRVPQSVPHLCYCLTPMRYLWDQYDAYFGGRPLEPAIRMLLGGLRRRDVTRAAGVTKFVAISRFIRERIQRCYGTDSTVVYPPVRTDWITPATGPADDSAGFLCASALVPYKNVGAIVQAFNKLGFPLTIIGEGPEGLALRRSASANIKFIDRVSDKELARHYSESKGLVFAAVEDFGMVPVEMQAAGRPVIALGHGGALETVIAPGSQAAENSRQTGVFFADAEPSTIISAIDDFMGRQPEFSVDNCIKQGHSFSKARFVDGFIGALDGLISGDQLKAVRCSADLHGAGLQERGQSAAAILGDVGQLRRSVAG